MGSEAKDGSRSLDGTDRDRAADQRGTRQGAMSTVRVPRARRHNTHTHSYTHTHTLTHTHMGHQPN